MNTLYFALGVIILIMGIITYYRPRAVRFISLSQKPRTTSILTLGLGIILIIVGLVA
jgi:lysyl-tRNA synthetase class I